ncbi:MAG: hypothetical protein K0S47_2043, partial [Herbinix sp.]|nr:hypothetical protein [Herbinix sp.]
YAASRAMLVHSRLFTGFGYDQEEVANQDGTVTVLNHMDRYAMGNNVTIRVVDEQEKPMPEALVRVEIVNSAELFPIAILRTGEDGTASIKLGLGEVHLQGLYKGATGSTFVNVKEANEVTVIINKENPSQGWTKYRITAPDSVVMAGVDMTKEQEQLQDEKNKVGDLLRQKRQDSYYDEDYVNQWKEYPSILHTLNNAKGNFDEIRKFLDTKISGVGVSEKDSLLKVIFLKDCRDIKAETLLDQLDALRYQNLYEKEIFEQYVLSPMISIEKATPFRSFIRNYFGDKGEELVKNPEQLLAYLDTEIVYYPEKEYDTIVSTPKSTLTMKAASPLSKKVLFVAICRTYGLAARLDQVYSEPQYYTGNGFVFADEKLRDQSRLTLVSKDGKTPVYYQQFTIGYKNEDGSYQTLDLWGTDFMDGKLVVELIPGNYRIVTCDRMNSGSILGKINYVTLSPGQEQELSLVCSELKAEDLITETPLPSFGLLDGEGKYTGCDVICGEDKNIFVFADPGKEPTEHVFNEMLQLAKMGEFPPCKIHLILKEGALLKDETLCKFLKVYGETALWKDEQDHTLTAFGLATGVDATKLPFIAVTKGSNRCIYSCSGYRVGSADVLARLVRE